MDDAPFPPLSLSAWQPTRDTLQVYARLLSLVRRSLTPPRRHWQHASLSVLPDGLTTTPIPLPNARGQTFQMILGLGPRQGGHCLHIGSSREEHWEMPLDGQSPRHYCDGVLAFLANMGIYPAVDQALFAGTTPGTYDLPAVERFVRALDVVERVLAQLKAELPGETSPIQFWTHHFDLAFSWYSGRRVPGVDPADEEQADEQMTFGFSTGDEGTPDPYFYATAYPWPDGLEWTALPAGGAWHMAGWRGAQLMHDTLHRAGQSGETLLEFLRAAYRAGRDALRSST